METALEQALDSARVKSELRDCTLRERLAMHFMAGTLSAECGYPIEMAAEDAVKAADTLLYALATLPFKPQQVSRKEQEEKDDFNLKHYGTRYPTMSDLNQTPIWKNGEPDDELKEQQQWGHAPLEGAMDKFTREQERWDAGVEEDYNPSDDPFTDDDDIIGLAGGELPDYDEEKIRLFNENYRAPKKP